MQLESLEEESPHPKSKRRVSQCCAIKHPQICLHNYSDLFWSSPVFNDSTSKVQRVRKPIRRSRTQNPQPVFFPPSFAAALLISSPRLHKFWRAHWASAGRPAFLKSAETERRWREAHLPHLGNTPPCFIPSLSPSPATESCLSRWWLKWYQVCRVSKRIKNPDALTNDEVACFSVFLLRIMPSMRTCLGWSPHALPNT